jgi:hypothetical protein
MTRKIISVLLVLVAAVVLGLAGCGGGGSSSNPTTSGSGSGSGGNSNIGGAPSTSSTIALGPFTTTLLSNRQVTAGSQTGYYDADGTVILGDGSMPGTWSVSSDDTLTLTSSLTGTTTYRVQSISSSDNSVQVLDITHGVTQHWLVDSLQPVSNTLGSAISPVLPGKILTIRVYGDTSSSFAFDVSGTTGTITHDGVSYPFTYFLSSTGVIYAVTSVGTIQVTPETAPQRVGLISVFPAKLISATGVVSYGTGTLQ